MPAADLKSATKGSPKLCAVGVGLPAGLLYEMLKQHRTTGEQAATILLPNCLILDGTGSGDKVPRSEKSPINKGFLVRYVTRTDVYNRITKRHAGPADGAWLVCLS
jgi:hypothetical protein